MKYRYREPHEMKESGVEWLGMIPREWEVSRLKYHFNIKSGATPKSDIEDYWGGDINWYTPVDLGETKFLNDSKRKITENGLRGCSATVIKAGSLIVSSRAPIGSIGISTTDFTTSQGCKSLESTGTIIDDFIYYYISISKKNLESLGSGTTFLEISGMAFSNYQTPYFKLEEQQKISNFLDQKCSQFDSIIAKKESLITKLEEAKKSLISEVVTGKVKVIEKSDGSYEIIKREPHEMKESGVEWLGMIPREWEVSKLKYELKTIKGYAFKAEFFIEKGCPIVKASDIKNGTIVSGNCFLDYELIKNYEKVKLREKDIVMSTVGSTPDVVNSAVGQLALVPLDYKDALLNQNTVIFRIRDIERIEQEYMYFLMNNHKFRKYLDLIAHGTANQASLTLKEILEFEIIFPLKSDQKIILNYLRNKIYEFENLKNKTNIQIEKLKLAKQSLISETVTGKIEVL